MSNLYNFLKVWIQGYFIFSQILPFVLPIFFMMYIFNLIYPKLLVTSRNFLNVWDSCNKMNETFRKNKIFIYRCCLTKASEWSVYFLFLLVQFLLSIKWKICSGSLTTVNVQLVRNPGFTVYICNTQPLCNSS